MGREAETGEICVRCGGPLRPFDMFCILCATPRALGSTAMDGRRTAGAGAPRRFGRPWSRRWAIALVALEATVVVVLAGVFTGGLGLWSAEPTGPPPPAGVGPNPFHETVNAVYLELTYTGNGSGYFQAAPDGNLCDQCPALPSRDDQSGAPVATLLVFFNLTNEGGGSHALGGFSVSTRNVTGTGPFMIEAVLCCGPSYLESASQAELGPGETLALALLFESSAVPTNGGAGYVLDFGADSPY